jgi:NTP pyrophosphatase (non-canonical NTP hydrolase)
LQLAEASARTTTHNKGKTMNLKEYSVFVESKILTEGTDRLAENTLGLVGEAGEVAEKIKKRFRDGKLDREAVQKELGDVLFYWSALHNLLGLCPDHTIEVNVDKLTDREARGVLRGSGDNR